RQAKPELNVAKPHLFRERSDQGLVWGLGRGSPQRFRVRFNFYIINTINTIKDFGPYSAKGFRADAY
ncbi:hypothetical protein Lpp7_15405, partial [Lacticaseibacillus paracasei subsp. paracasei Lpp7]